MTAHHIQDVGTVELATLPMGRGVWLRDIGENLCMSAGEARQLARALNRVADEVEA